MRAMGGPAGSIIGLEDLHLQRQNTRQVAAPGGRYWIRPDTLRPIGGISPLALTIEKFKTLFKHEIRRINSNNSTNLYKI